MRPHETGSAVSTTAELVFGARLENTPWGIFEVSEETIDDRVLSVGVLESLRRVRLKPTL